MMISVSGRTGVSGKEGLAYFRKAYNLEIGKVERDARREQLKMYEEIKKRYPEIKESDIIVYGAGAVRIKGGQILRI